MTNRELTLPFKDIESLINNTNYVLLIYSGSSFYNSFSVNIEDYLYISFLLGIL